jgi:hypothetical protein
VAHDVQHIAVGIADEEAAYSPSFVLQRVDNFMASSLCLFLCSVDVVDLYGNNWVGSCGGIVRDEPKVLAESGDAYRATQPMLKTSALRPRKVV